MPDDGDLEFPVPFKVFSASLVGTPDEIWTKLLQNAHGRENHLISDWQALLDALKAAR